MLETGYNNVAVLIPCYNEASTIAKVIQDFAKALPGVRIYVFDNNSSDGTLAAALAAGAVGREVRYQGKGNVVRRMFADIEADIYVLVDGDDTYDAAQAPHLVSTLLANSLDMVVGMRETRDNDAYRRGHRSGNLVLTRFVTMIFGHAFKDILSGYRVFSRRFAKSFPAHAAGFEIETELTVHALQLRMPVLEIPSDYRARPAGSLSKLDTYRDGIRILRMIFVLFIAEKPLAAFSIGFASCLCVSYLFGGATIQHVPCNWASAASTDSFAL